MPSVRSMMSCRILGRQHLVADDAVDHGGDFALPKPPESQAGDVGSANPRRLKFRAIRDDKQNPDGLDPINAATQRFQTRGVNPMDILEDHQQRSLLGKGDEFA